MLQSNKPTSESPNMQKEGPTSSGKVGQDKQKSRRWLFFFTMFWSGSDCIALWLDSWGVITGHATSPPSLRNAWGAGCLGSLYKYSYSVWHRWWFSVASLEGRTTLSKDSHKLQRGWALFPEWQCSPKFLSQISWSLGYAFLGFPYTHPPGVGRRKGTCVTSHGENKMGFHMYCRYHFCNFGE